MLVTILLIRYKINFRSSQPFKDTLNMLGVN